MSKTYTPCGGCGATEPDQRCIGCMHPFTEIKPDELPVTPEWELINRIVSQWGNAIEMPNMEQWLKDYAATRHPRIGWVKASERLPAEGKQVFARDSSGRKTIGYFTRSNLASALIDTFYSMVGGFYIKGKDYESLEWYDESAAGREEDATEYQQLKEKAENMAAEHADLKLALAAMLNGYQNLSAYQKDWFTVPIDLINEYTKMVLEYNEENELFKQQKEK